MGVDGQCNGNQSCGGVFGTPVQAVLVLYSGSNGFVSIESLQTHANLTYSPCFLCSIVQGTSVGLNHLNSCETPGSLCCTVV